MAEIIRITVAEGALRRASKIRIEAVYRSDMGLRASHLEMPEVILAATEENKVVATIGLNFKSRTHPLPLEKLYRVPAVMPFRQFRPGIGVEYVRWTAEPRVGSRLGLAMVSAASVYAARKQHTYGLLEAKHPIPALFRRNGIDLRAVPGAALQKDEIPPGHLYYALPPLPALYAFRPLQIAEALKKKISAAKTGVEIDIAPELVL